MTPKDKAIELFYKIEERQLLSSKEQYPSLTKEVVRECALIVVDEVLEQIDNPGVSRFAIIYWNRVIKEINNI